VRSMFIVYVLCCTLSGICFYGMIINAVREDVRGFTVFLLFMVVFLGIVPMLLVNIQHRMDDKKTMLKKKKAQKR